MTKHKNLFIQSVVFLLMTFSLALTAAGHGDKNIDMEILKQAIRDSMAIKPKGHEFNLVSKPVIMRHMSVTGG